MKFIENISSYFESQAFGVCAKLGEKLQMSTASIRLFFIYASFLTFGSPIILYMGLAFIINIRKHMRRGRNSVWYC
jgi:phage shock protein PspC (stress-responsive transcriptional regulator)